MKRWILRQWYKIPYYDSREDNAFYGKFRVLYNDGEQSIPMCWKVANEYANIFGGVVIDNF